MHSGIFITDKKQIVGVRKKRTSRNAKRRARQYSPLKDFQKEKEMG